MLEVAAELTGALLELTAELVGKLLDVGAELVGMLLAVAAELGCALFPAELVGTLNELTAELTGALLDCCAAELIGLGGNSAAADWLLALLIAGFELLTAELFTMLLELLTATELLLFVFPLLFPAPPQADSPKILMLERIDLHK